MPSFCPINLPRSVSTSPAKPNQGSSPPHGSAQELHTTRRKRSAESAAEDKGSNPSRSSERRRKLLKTYHPIDPAIATPLKVNVTTSNAERFSRGSITFPDLRTLPKPQPQKTETIRVLPNRAVKILPSVEEQSRPSEHLEIVDLEASSPVVCGSDRNGSREIDHTSQTRASTEFSTVFPDLALQQGNNGFVSDEAALKIPTNTPEMSIPRGRSQSYGTTIINSSARITTPLPATFTPIKNESRSFRTVSSTPTRRTQNRKGNGLIQDHAVHMLTPRTKRRKLDEDGIIQQPQEEYGLDVIQSTRQQLKRIESCLLSQEIFWQGKRRDRELQAEAKRLADAKREKRTEGKERHILRGAQRVNRNKSRRHGSSANYNSAITVPVTEAFGHASNTEHIRPEQVQNAAGTLHSANAKPMSGQVQVEARSCTNLRSERQQREQAASDKLTVAHALDRDNGEVSKCSLVLSTGKVPEGQNRSQAKAQAQGVAGSTLKRPMTTSSAGLSTADRVRIQKQRDNGGRSKRGATVSNTKNTRYSSGRPWVYAHFKREVIMNHLRRPCVCDLLHPYFLQARWFEPKLEAFPGCKAQFLAHAEQIVHCDAHSRQLRHFCRLLVEKEDSTNSGPSTNLSSNGGAAADMDVEAACTFANRFLSSHSPPIGGQSTMGPPNTRNRSQHAATTVNATSRSDLREQSIIPPWEFYGLGSSRHLPQRNQPEPTPRPSSPPKGVKAANFADLGQVDASLDVENEATEDFGTDDPATHEASGALPDFEDEGGESGLLVSSPPKLDRVLPLRELSANERIRRHQSMPARINRNVEGHIERGSLGDTSGLGSLEEEIARVRLADRAVPTVRTGVPEPPRRKSKKKCVAERKIIEPGLSRHVPLHQRKSDAELLQIARLITPYQRHRRAPYAFSYLGRLYAEYKHLRVAVDYNDRLILTAQELSRL